MATLKQQQKVAKELEDKIGRPPATPKEMRLRAAASGVLSGAITFADAKRLYAVAQMEITRFINGVFPTDAEKYEFLEQCMMQNALLASSRFQQCFSELTPIDAARAATIFAGKATDIRKAREAGFKEAPISITAIIALQQTLNKLTSEPKE